MQSTKMKEIDLDTYLSVVAASEVHQTLDLGPVMLVKVTHPTLGAVILVNSAEHRNAIISQ